MTDRRYAVVGGGIAGLASAYRLSQRGQVTVYEPGALGGKLITDVFEGRRVDLGPDAFLTRVPQAVELCADLGLTGSLVAPTTGSAWLVTQDGPRPMPAGLVLGVPRDLVGVARSRLLSPAGLLRAGADLVLPRQAIGADVSVHELVARRFGSQTAERLVDPLVGGIHAGSIEDLSAAATTPQLLAAARRGRSLLRSLGQTPPPADGPVFLAPAGGMAEFTGALMDQLDKAGGSVVRSAVTEVRAAGPHRVAVDGEGYDGVVIAAPSDVAHRLLGPSAPPGLAGIARASVAIALMSYPETELPAPPGVSGLLVQRRTGRIMTATSFASTKWPAWASAGTTLLRVSAGQYRDRRIDALDDDTLTERLVAEVGEVLGSGATPKATRMVRWPDAFPQYLVGHLERVDGIEAELRRSGAPIAVAGASYRGSGIPACIGSGQRAAETILADQS